MRTRRFTAAARFLLLSLGFFLLLILGALVAYAAPPPCYPGEPTADAQTADQVKIFATPEGQCAQWFCDAGHKWVPVSICGTDAEAVLAAPALRAAMLLSKDAKDALWNSTFTQPVVTDSPDDLMLKAAAARPLPSQLPPSGLITVDTRLFKQVLLKPGFRMAEIGTLPLGLPCNSAITLTDPTTKKRYFAIDRTAAGVKMTQVGGLIPPLPPTGYGICE